MKTIEEIAEWGSDVGWDDVIFQLIPCPDSDDEDLFDRASDAWDDAYQNVSKVFAAMWGETGQIGFDKDSPHGEIMAATFIWELYI